MLLSLNLNCRYNKWELDLKYIFLLNPLFSFNKITICCFNLSFGINVIFILYKNSKYMFIYLIHI